MKKIIALFLSLLICTNTLPAHAGVAGGINTDRASAHGFVSVSEEAAGTVIIITWEDGFPAEAHSEILGEYDIMSFVSFDDKDFSILELPPDTDAAALCNALSEEDGIVCAEPDSGTLLCAATDDYYSSTQWWLDNTGSYSQIEGASEIIMNSTPGIDIDGPEGWEFYNSDPDPKRSVIIAVIDTGIDYTHPELTDSMWCNYAEIADNGIDDDGNGYIDDFYGWDFYNGDSSICHYYYNEQLNANLSSPLDCDDHGTHCAGIIAAKANNGIGIAGIASVGDIKLMSLKIHGGPDKKGSISDAIKAIKYAEMMGAEICNMSWGSYTKSTSLYTAIERSRMLFIAAAGNDGSNNDLQPLYPACFELDNIISVGYVDPTGEMAYESNYGAGSVDVVAPSTNVFSTFVGTYSTLSGSSMAAPQVSAIAALLYSCSNGLYASNAREIILAGCKPLDSLKGFVGAGLPSLLNTLAMKSLLLNDFDAPTAEIHKHYYDNSFLLTMQPEDIGTSGLHLIRYYNGRRTCDDFKNGTSGTVVTDNNVLLSKSGRYTFYISDKAGNYTLKDFMVIEDIIPPAVSSCAITVNDSRDTITISAGVKDNQSGIKAVRYTKGFYDKADFPFASAEEVPVGENGQIMITVHEEGTYTICVTDYRGNKTIKHVMAYIRKATDISLNKRRRVMTVGWTFKLEAELTPLYSTDTVSFKSSDESIAVVDSFGEITAISPGVVMITAVTCGGKTAECEITVQEAEN